MGFGYRFSTERSFAVLFTEMGNRTWSVCVEDTEGVLNTFSGFRSIHECAMRILLLTGTDVSRMTPTWIWRDDDMCGRFVSVQWKKRKPA
jgi:hypothetical protein